MLGFNEVIQMTLKFKKVRDFEKQRFHRKFEEDISEEEEGDIYMVDNLDSDVDNDYISTAEAGFMLGYLSA